MSAFRSLDVTLRGEVLARGGVEEVFRLFSPAGEKAWVPGWNPEMLHPPGAGWARGQIFRTREEKGEAVWIVTGLEPERHRVEYHRVEPGRYVARIEVACSPAGPGAVRAEVAYSFIGLSEAGNREIGEMTPEAYAAKMKRWEGWIRDHLAGRVLAPLPPAGLE